MNSTSLYVSTCRLVLQADCEDPASWADLYRLVPYLRQSLSCTVCGNLLIEPFTPTDTNCQHHVCKTCQGGIYRKLVTVSSNGGASLMDLINEGAGFKDDYKSTAGLSKSAYSILPCVYTTTSTSTQTQVAASSTPPPPSIHMDTPIKTVSNGSSLYSVMYASGNKITIKRKSPSSSECTSSITNTTNTVTSVNNSGTNTVSTSPTEYIENDANFKKPKIKPSKPKTKKKGCRCGNATATPGKLTCCGQRCPCYVEAKACVECRCRGCRNPHRPGGKKVRPHIPELHSIQIHLPASAVNTGNEHQTMTMSAGPHHLTHTTGGMVVGSIHTAPQQLSAHLVPSLAPTSILEASTVTSPSTTSAAAVAAAAAQVLGVHPQLVYAPSSTLNLQNVSSVLPAALLVGDEKSPSNSESESENSDVDIDVDV
ncbi:hypothetical protein B566_EDAN012198 [Ephemera danica]|nr:hypothetical protein B566_EDAN012198 [Ephemera danica]